MAGLSVQRGHEARVSFPARIALAIQGKGIQDVVRRIVDSLPLALPWSARPGTTRRARREVALEPPFA